MTTLRRVEMLEAVLLQARDDAGYKLVLLKDGESSEEGIARSELNDWPADRTMVLKFVSADKQLTL
jgi:hypothetical protein